jgi:hypothetical protein
MSLASALIFPSVEKGKKLPLIPNHFSREPSNGTTSDQWLKWALFFLSTKLSPAKRMGNASGNLAVLKPGGHPLCYLGFVVFIFPCVVLFSLPSRILIKAENGSALWTAIKIFFYVETRYVSHAKRKTTEK